MEFSVFDLLENKLSAKNISNELLPHLQKKYNEIFEIVRIGNRYGYLNNGRSATIYARPLTNPSLIFSVIVTDKENGYSIEDNYYLKLLTNKLEKKLIYEFKENGILSIVKSDIIGVGNLDNTMSLEDFSKKNPTSNFLSNIIICNNCSIETFHTVFENLKNTIPQLYLKTLIYIVDEESFNKLKNEIDTLPDITKAMIERYNIKDRKILRIKDNKVEIIK